MDRKHVSTKRGSRPRMSLGALAAIVGLTAASGARTSMRQFPSIFGRRTHPRSQAFRVGAWAGDGVLSKRRIKPRAARTR